MIKSSQTLVTIYTELTSAQHISTSTTQLMMLKTKMKKKKTNKTKMMMKILKKTVKTSKQSKNKKEAQSLKSQNANNNDLKVTHCWFLYLFITYRTILFFLFNFFLFNQNRQKVEWILFHLNGPKISLKSKNKCVKNEPWKIKNTWNSLNKCVEHDVELTSVNFISLLDSDLFKIDNLYRLTVDLNKIIFILFFLSFLK